MYGGHRIETEFGHKPFELFAHAAQARIRTPARNKTRGQARLFRVDFPGVKVDAGRLAFRVVNPANAGRSVAVRKKPQIPAAAHRRDIVSRKAHGGNRHLAQRPGSRLQHGYVPAEARNAVAIVRDRINAGVMRETALRQNVQSPKGTGRNRIAWRAIDTRPYSASVFNYLNGALGILP